MKRPRSLSPQQRSIFRPTSCEAERRGGTLDNELRSNQSPRLNSVCPSVCVCEGWALWLQPQSHRQLLPTSFLFLGREERVAVTVACYRVPVSLDSLCFSLQSCILWSSLAPSRLSTGICCKFSGWFWTYVRNMEYPCNCQANAEIRTNPRPRVHLRCWKSIVIVFYIPLLFGYIWRWMIAWQGRMKKRPEMYYNKSNQMVP